MVPFDAFYSSHSDVHLGNAGAFTNCIEKQLMNVGFKPRT